MIDRDLALFDGPAFDNALKTTSNPVSVFRAALATKFGYVRATEISASIGQFVAFALGFIGLLYNPLLFRLRRRQNVIASTGPWK